MNYSNLSKSGKDSYLSIVLQISKQVYNLTTLLSKSLDVM